MFGCRSISIRERPGVDFLKQSVVGTELSKAIRGMMDTKNRFKLARL